MNISTITNFLQESSFKQIVLLVYLVVAITVVAYNWLYLSHSLRVATNHIGMNAPFYIRGIIKTSIFIAVIAAGFSIFLLLTGWY